MKRWIVVFLAVAAIVAVTIFASHWLLPKTYKLSESVVRTSVFWNHKEAFFFVSMNTSGRAMNVLQEKFTTSRYGYPALLLDPPESFFKQDTIAYHLLASGKLDRVSLPERTDVFGTWTLNDGNLQLNSVATRYGSKNGFRWDGEKFVPVAPSSANSPARKTELSPDDEDDDDVQDGVSSGVERESFKAAGWHYKFLNGYQGRNLTATLPMQLDQSVFNLTVHSFAMPTDIRNVIDLDGVGIRQMEISGDKLEPQTLWKQNGRREISKVEFERLQGQSGYRIQRPYAAILWLLVLLLVAFWKLASWGHLLLGFG
ncbi:MAG: hypothetical protein DMG65_21685 [Candidatus Angelobacter sp. Gp1-AA117]|nr:MAG: hypothetical protein DMG65_21685 [Candidatus Angelobacter sp. Gp1-AA117]